MIMATSPSSGVTASAGPSRLKAPSSSLSSMSMQRTCGGTIARRARSQNTRSTDASARMKATSCGGSL